MAKVDVMSKQEDKEQLAYILLLLVAVQSLVPFELGANIGQLLVDALDFCLLTFTYGQTTTMNALSGLAKKTTMGQKRNCRSLD